MDEVARVRSATREAMADIAPAGLRSAIEDHLRACAVTPGVVTVASAHYHGSAPLGDRPYECAGAVQQIHTGLAVTAELIDETPWAEDVGHPIDADLSILAADVLVARGMSTLAPTAAAEAAVTVVRAFGQDQAQRRNADATAHRRPFADRILELAIIAGAASVEVSPDHAVVDAIVSSEDDADPDPAGVLEDTPLEGVLDGPSQARTRTDEVQFGATDTD